MSRSSPMAPGYLLGAIWVVEELLADRYPVAMTAREIADVLRERGYRWPLRNAHGRGWNAGAEPTAERVRRVCELKANRTYIAPARPFTRPMRYTLYDWALETVMASRKGRA